MLFKSLFVFFAEFKNCVQKEYVYWYHKQIFYKSCWHHKFICITIHYSQPQRCKCKVDTHRNQKTGAYCFWHINFSAVEKQAVNKTNQHFVECKPWEKCAVRLQQIFDYICNTAGHTRNLWAEKVACHCMGK